MSTTVNGRAKKKTLMESIIDLIRTEMERQELSPTVLAKRAGVGFPYLYRVLNGEHAPTLEWIDKIAKALGITIEVTATKNS